MERLVKYPLIFVTILLFLMACSDNFLSPKPKSFYTSQNTFTGKDGFEAQVITMRKNINAEQTGNRSIMMHQWAASEAGVPLVQMDFRKLTPSQDKYQHFVSQINDIYGFIKDANVAISRIDNIEWKDQSERDAILAEALWHRAYWYYRLVGNYGDIPWIGKEVKGAKLDFNTYSREAILDKIQADLEFAVQHLPVSASPGAITKGAGNYLLTKVYLASMKFDKAVEAATEVINGPYHLMRQRFGVDAGDPTRNVIWDLHRPANKNDPQNSETILAFVDRFEAPENARSSGLWTMRTYNASWWHSRNRDSEGGQGMIHIPGDPQTDTLGVGNPDCALTEWYQYGLWDEGDYQWDNTPDLRRADINWREIDEIEYNNPESVDYGKKWNLEWVTGNKYEVFSGMYAMPIYKTSVQEDEPNATRYGGNGDWYIYRLAGVYLLRAEAYYWKGERGRAAADINKVRTRAHAPTISAGDVTIDEIFDERARELFAESPRQNELVRVSYIMAEKGINGYSEKTLYKNNWFYDRVISRNMFYPQYTGGKMESFLGLSLPVGKKLTVIGQSPHIKPHHFLWPIDDGLINTNTLGTINQNKGYAGAQNNKSPKEHIEETSYK